MSIATPENRQLEALLWYLRQALLTDTFVLAALGPDQIVNSTAEYDPTELVRDGDGNEYLALYDTELPILAVWVESAEVVRVGQGFGMDSELGLLYAFRAAVGGDGVPPRAWTSRVSQLIWWRLCYHLRRHRIDYDGDVYDLIDAGHIYSIEATRWEAIDGGEYAGIRGTLRMVACEPPYSEKDRTALATVAIREHPGSTIPTEPIVGGDYDVT